MGMHALLDGLAWLTTALAVVVLRRWRGGLFASPGRPSPGYLAAVAIGGATGAYLLGSLNAALMGYPGLSRSIEGALAGAILGVEIYKWRTGLTGRTAALFALPLALGIAVGRVGCYLSGLDDLTYGTPTSLPWGHDFGDGVLRHPVQLYESAAMLVFAVVYLVALWRRQAFVVAQGFALFVLYYAVQRFGLEYLKPYPDILPGLSVFQVVCIGLVVYALVILRSTRLPDARHA